MPRLFLAAKLLGRVTGLTAQILWIDIQLLWNRVQWLWYSR